MKGISLSKMTANFDRSWSKYQGVFVCGRLSTTKIIPGIIPCWCSKNRSWSFSIGPNEPKSGSKLTFKLWRMNSEITRLILFPFILYTPEIDLNFLKSSFFSIFGNVALKCEKNFRGSIFTQPSPIKWFDFHPSAFIAWTTRSRTTWKSIDPLWYIKWYSLLENDQLEPYCSSLQPK